MSTRPRHAVDGTGQCADWCERCRIDGPPPTVHKLACLAPYFEDVATGRKTFELRKDDRGFAVGDLLCLAEAHQPGGIDIEATGRTCTVEVLYVLRGGTFGLDDRYVAMSVEVCKHPSPPTRPGAWWLRLDPEWMDRDDIPASAVDAEGRRWVVATVKPSETRPDELLVGWVGFSLMFLSVVADRILESIEAVPDLRVRAQPGTTTATTPTHAPTTPARADHPNDVE